MPCAANKLKRLVDDLCPACVTTAFKDGLTVRGPVITMQNKIGHTVEVPYGAVEVLARLRMLGYREVAWR